MKSLNKYLTNIANSPNSRTLTYHLEIKIKILDIIITNMISITNVSLEVGREEDAYMNKTPIGSSSIVRFKEHMLHSNK